MSRTKRPWVSMILVWACSANALNAQQTTRELRDEAKSSLKKAAAFFQEKVASHGGYAYYYSEDLSTRWGEGKVSLETIVVQPPGTPTVGMACLKAYAATGEPFYLDIARSAAEALVYGQLKSGGWTQVIEFDDAKKPPRYRDRKGASRHSSLDDGQTQAALELLILADQALEFKHAAIHEAAAFGLLALLNAQFPNGAFPQVWTGPVVAQPVVKPRYPDYDWKTAGRIKNYWDYYTLNDNLAGTVTETLITAHQVYKDEKYKSAVEKFGDFLILAQMPDPQPGWCQQYNYEMIPIWARKFEPPAVTGWESQDVMRTLIRIARYTGEKKYLEPIPRALAYFQKSLLEDGRVARYYEFLSNKPLYMDANYQLTYDASAAPSHYGWKQSARFAEIDRDYQAALRGTLATQRQSTSDLEKRVRQIIRDLDREGRWIQTYSTERLVGQPKFSAGFRYLSSDVFSRNVELLSDYITAAGSQ